MTASYQLAEGERGRSLTVLINGELRTITSEGQIEQVLDALLKGVSEDEILELLDASIAVGRKFTTLSDRVVVANGQVYFDDAVVDSTITRQILRFLDEGVEDWQPLVAFLENLAANPNSHSRSQLYGWLDGRDFTITEDGCFIAYKGVRWDGATPKSIRSGPGIVNGVKTNGHLDNTPGNTVGIERDKVDFDPARGCSGGLHVGSWDYAESFGQGSTLKVKVNPANVVSVPTDCDWAKVRVCEYEVLSATLAPIPTAITFAWEDETDDWYDELGN